MANEADKQELSQNRFTAKIPIGESPGDLALGLAQSAERLSAEIFAELKAFGLNIPSKEN